MYPTIQLKAGKEANVAFRHPWVYSGAIESSSHHPSPLLGEEGKRSIQHGDLVHVTDRKGDIIGTGTYSNASSIAVRVFDFSEAVIDKEWLSKKIKAADDRCKLMGYGPGTDTTGYRMVFGEADQIPGLVVDRYEDVLVIQIATAGLDRLREVIVECLVELFAPKAIVERSDMNVRHEEKLEESHGVLYGDPSDLVDFKENGVSFVADVLNGQKTGFFMDQKDLRKKIRSLSAGKENVLNLFSYSGSAGVNAMLGGAKHVHNVDASDLALALCKKHGEMNGVEMTTEQTDIFQWLNDHQEAAYDMVLMDPPSIIKTAKDTENGKKAYHFLNRAAIKLVKDGGIFVTSSCSYFMNEEDLAFTLRRASVQAGVTLEILGVVRQAADHPLSVYFPEASYLKSFVCQVRREVKKYT